MYSYSHVLPEMLVKRGCGQCTPVTQRTGTIVGRSPATGQDVALHDPETASFSHGWSLPWTKASYTTSTSLQAPSCWNF